MKERGIRELFFLGGEDGTKNRPCPATLPFTLLGLGWIYQLFWNSINAEIQLPLHKVLGVEAGAHLSFSVRRRVQTARRLTKTARLSKRFTSHAVHLASISKRAPRKSKRCRQVDGHGL